MAQKLFKLFYFYLPPNCKTPHEINSCIDIYGTSYLLLKLKIKDEKLFLKEQFNINFKVWCKPGN